MSLYEVLKASKTERFPDYWTLLWGRKLSASMIKTITGVLPLTFTAKGGTAVDWEIRGNDDVGENIYPTTITTSSGGGFDFTVNADGTIRVTGTATVSSTYFKVLGTIDVPAGTYTITGCPSGGSWGGSNSQTYCTSVQIAGIGTLYETGDGVTVTTQSETTIKLIITLSVSLSNIDLTYKPMVVKGSTAPDHYIPYQRGAGERTVNEYGVNGSASISTVSAVCNDSEITIQSDGTNSTVSANNAEYKNNFSVSLSAGNYGYKIERTGTTTRIAFSIYDSNNTAIGTSQTSGTFTLSANKSVYIGFYVPANTTVNGTVKLIITKGSTAPSTYVPYGYEIPISVNGTPQTFYIGNSPLTAGQSISKTSTGVDIELFEGENTVSTTLYNKPTMEIKYK